ncbi:MAG: hypothetical protein ACI8TE_001222 [Francisella sp.]|jgi:hypothetical protein
MCSHLEDIVRNICESTSTSEDAIISIHNYVRDNIEFGFTTKFESVTPEETIKNKIGHCNAQADLLVKMFRIAGYESRLRFVYISKKILKNAIPLPIYALLPKKLYHAVSEVKFKRWISLDSYIMPKVQFDKQMNRLVASGLEVGFGLHHKSTYNCDIHNNSFSQAMQEDLYKEDIIYNTLAEAEKKSGNKIFGVHFNSLLKPINILLNKPFSLYINRTIKR